LTPAIAVCLAALLLLVLSALPRILLRRAQDRMARKKIQREQALWKLLTRADRVVGRYRRLPGLLGLKQEEFVFESLFGDTLALATARIRKIVTGRRLASGRLLLRLEVLRITAASGEEVEFVLSRAAAEAWRSHLGLWAARQRQADADRVSPGRR
jgi:hypothetical protein